MTGALRISVGDGLADPKGDFRALVASMVADVNAQWARHGVAGVDIVKAEWDAARGFVFIETIPGAQSLTVGRVSAYLKAERAKVAERWANGMGQLL